MIDGKMLRDAFIALIASGAILGLCIALPIVALFVWPWWGVLLALIPPVAMVLIIRRTL